MAQDCCEGGFVFFDQAPQSQWHIQDISHLFTKQNFEKVKIYNIYNNTNHSITISRSKKYTNYPNIIYIDNSATNLYLNTNLGQNIYLIIFDETLFICCEDGKIKKYFQLEKKQKIISGCILSEDENEDIGVQEEKIIDYWHPRRVISNNSQ